MREFVYYHCPRHRNTVFYSFFVLLRVILEHARGPSRRGGFDGGLTEGGDTGGLRLDLPLQGSRPSFVGRQVSGEQSFHIQL